MRNTNLQSDRFIYISTNFELAGLTWDSLLTSKCLEQAKLLLMISPLYWFNVNTKRPLLRGHIQSFAARAKEPVFPVLRP